jgi:hypothetical protein
LVGFLASAGREYEQFSDSITTGHEFELEQESVDDVSGEEFELVLRSTDCLAATLGF